MAAAGNAKKTARFQKAERALPQTILRQDSLFIHAHAYAATPDAPGEHSRTADHSRQRDRNVCGAGPLMRRSRATTPPAVGPSRSPQFAGDLIMSQRQSPSAPSQISRRSALAGAAVALALPVTAFSQASRADSVEDARMSDTHSRSFWPNSARLAVRFSLMFEAGGQPISGAGGVIPDPIQQGLPDLPTNSFFEYGVYEGIPRILDLFDKHQIKLSSFMIGHAV